MKQARLVILLKLVILVKLVIPVKFVILVKLVSLVIIVALSEKPKFGSTPLELLFELACLVEKT